MLPVGGAGVAFAVPQGFEIQIVVSGMEFPTAVAFPPPPDDRVFYLELTTGRVRVVESGEISDTPFVSIPDVGTGTNQGMLGLALDPDFATNHYVYINHTQAVPLRNRIVRYTDVAGVGRDPAVILDDIPSSNTHQGGPIEFAADGSLFVQTGDLEAVIDGVNGALAQDMTSLAGKILRILPNPDDPIPPDNPFVGVPGVREEIYSLGHRNGFGMFPALALDGESIVVFASENGPNDADEVNRILPGRNYGWPRHLGAANEPGFEDPIFVWSGPFVVSPTGICRYSGRIYPKEFRDDLYVGHYNHSFERTLVQRLRLSGDGLSVEGGEVFVPSMGQAFALDVLEGPDGRLYFTTSTFAPASGVLYRVDYPLQSAIEGLPDADAGHAVEVLRAQAGLD